jgi:hypothetical protein
MDKRQYNGGHSTKGKAGRKPKADEIKLIEQLDSILAPDILWENVAQLITDKKDIQALKLWISYRYGQPKQQMQVEDKEVAQVDPQAYIDALREAMLADPEFDDYD